MQPIRDENTSNSLHTLRLALAAVMGLVAISLLPVIMAELSGPDAAGITVGFSEPLQHFTHIMLFFATGLAASRMGRQTLVMLPACFLLMLGVGALTDAALSQHAYARVWLFGSIMLYAVAVGSAYSLRFLFVAGTASAIAYYFGTVYMLRAPEVASLGYYIIGCQISVALVIACGISLGIATQGYTLAGLEKLKRVPLAGVLRNILW